MSLVTENPDTVTELTHLLSEVPEVGLHMRELAQLNELLGGYSTSLGLRFTTVERDKVCAEMPISHDHLQAMGLVNGGVYCAIAETVGSVMGLIKAPGKLVAGVNNNTDFLAPVRTGVLSAEASIIHAGVSTQLIHVDIFHRSTLVARSTLRTMVLKPHD
ncbi:PaaI family thioesterase [Corynebacterium sp. ES2715-CONJ3]|uniref:PaaI family thioesterase n=1 Tax=Corynebacterium sp. ES2715-CONJ3 TaxID=2974028 RepID=UPI00216A97B1|nr:PaaI family thioesterase [Corynebacterium sp. ES2715-CONJ3]MCS4491182.1 PaaI family thioesterase [Corynebacterium sp. ES2715-CONJ3]